MKVEQSRIIAKFENSQYLRRNYVRISHNILNVNLLLVKWVQWKVLISVGYSNFHWQKDENGI